MAAIRTFRDLVAWQKGMELVTLVYGETLSMPRDELFGLTSQMRRAATSVPANMAEGYGRHRLPDYLRHLRVARGSLYELDTHLEAARCVDMMIASPGLLQLLEETDRVLQGLIRSLEAKQRD